MTNNGINEVDIANEILGFVGNLDDEKDAFNFFELYIKAFKNVNLEFDVERVYNEVCDTDRRFLHFCFQNI